MKRLPVSAGAVGAAGLGLGILGDVLLRVDGEPALNLFLFIKLCVVAALVLQHRAGRVLRGEAQLLLGVGVLFAATLVWRDAPLLKLTALAAAAVSFALPAFRAGAEWARRAGMSQYIVAMAAAGVHAGMGTIVTFTEVDWGQLRQHSSGSVATRRALAAARGVVLALPALAVFGGLLIAADAVFADLVTNTLRVDLDLVASHIVLTGFLAWVATGALTGFLRGTSAVVPAGFAPRGGVLGIGEIGVALGLISLLFAVFVAVQFRYLFGGAVLVEVTPGLTYAEYARRGFFELLAVVLLSLPLLLVADWLLRRDSTRAVRVFRVIAGVQIVLLLAIATSALQRMRIYTQAYGLTEDRFHATAVLLLICSVLLWFGATVLRDRRESFAFGALIAAFLTGAALVAANPDAVIARTNIDRALAQSAVAPQADSSQLSPLPSPSPSPSESHAGALDVVHAASLSADAVPVLIERLPELEPVAQCRIAKRLLKRWAPEKELPLRSWNWSVARAKHLIRQNERALQAAAAIDCKP